MHRFPPLLAALVACGAPDPDGADTGTTASGPGITATCAVQPDNALRYDCAITTRTPGPIHVAWEAMEDGAVRELAVDGDTTEHRATVYALKPEWTYEVRFTGPDGTATLDLTPGPMPLPVGATASGDGPVPVLVALPCANEAAVAIVDTDGQPLWYQSFGPVDGRDDGYQFTPRGTVLAAFGDTIVETALDGTELLRFRRGEDFGDDPLHHDVHRDADGRIYALFAEEVDGAVLDGLHIFDDDGLIASWHLADHVAPAGAPGGGGPGFWERDFPGAVDWSHGNSVSAAGDGWLYVGFRWLSAAMKVDGDPASPTFGDVAWTLVGEAGKPLASDFALTSSAGLQADFIGQHHVNPTPDGRVALFDNRTTGSSRGVVLALDEAAGVADVQAQWEVGQVCTAQGATFLLDDGTALVTCATAPQVLAFPPGQAAPGWSLDFSCGGGFAMLPRGVPAPI